MKKYIFLLQFFFISLSIFGQQNWVLVMNQQMPFSDQIWRTRNHFPKNEIEEFWNEGYNITHLTYADDKWALVMSKNAGLGLQYWTYDKTFPEKNVNDYWAKGYHISQVTYGGGMWVVIMSDALNYEDQIWHQEENYPQAKIQEYWDNGYRITSLDHGQDGWILVMSKGGAIQEQEWRTRKEYPRAEIEELWKKGFVINQLTYGQDVWALVMSKGLGWGTQKWVTRPNFPEKEINDNWAKGFYITGLYHGDAPKKDNPTPIVYPKPTITWNIPYNSNVDVSKEDYQIRACVKSTSSISNIQVLVNNTPIQEARGFEVVPDDGCDNTVERNVKLKQGENKIQIIITNKGGTTQSEVRNVNYQIPEETKINVSNTGNEKRLALLIGNATYTKSPLKNPINDVRAMEKALKNMGFDVLKFENTSQNDMKKAINEYGQKLKDGKYDTGLFFYAGHGLQVKGNNYIMPVDANISQENDVEFECVEAGRVLAKMEGAGTRVNIVIMDACRDNPFERSWSRSTKGNGLAVMEAPVGSIVCYATSPGKTASDGEGTNGLYTEQLLKFMAMPNLPIEEVFKQVRIAVVDKSNKQQVPWETSSLTGNFFFKK